jgi:hypothetical protein
MRVAVAINPSATSPADTDPRNIVARPVDSAIVEGSGKVHTQFLIGDRADELHAAIAPFFVGESGAPRFVDDGRFPWNPDRRSTLAEVRQIGDVVLPRYALSSRLQDAGRPERRAAHRAGARHDVAVRRSDVVRIVQ